MADSNNLNHVQDGQHIFPPQLRPQLPPQVNQNPPTGLIAQGLPKMSAMPPAVGGQPYVGAGPPNSLMTPGPPQGQAPPPMFAVGVGGAPNLPPAGGSVNGFTPATTSQGPVPPRPWGVSRPPGPPTSAFQPAGNNAGFAVPGQSVPPGGVAGPFFPRGVGQTVNGKNTPPSAPGLQQPPGGQPGSQPGARFPPPPTSEGGVMAGPPRLPVCSSLPSASAGPAPPRMSAPVPGLGAGNAPPPPPTSGVSYSGSNTPTSGLLSPPSELPVPFHGQAQYSHQVGATMKITPNPTPTSSEPPSQRSSRDPSPVNEPSYDALEGQFSPGQGTPSPRPGSHRGSPLSAPGPPGPPYLPSQGKGTPRLPGQSMTPPPRPALPGAVPPGVGMMPPGSGVGAQLPGPQMMPPRPGYSPVVPYGGSGPAYQPRPAVFPPGPPTSQPASPPGLVPVPSSGSAPFSLGPPTSQPSAPPPGPFGPAGQGSAPPGPPSGPMSGPARPFQPGPPPLGQGSAPPGPPSGPFNLGPPTSGQVGSGSLSGPYSQGPPTSGQGSAFGQGGVYQPPTSQAAFGPPSGPTGPLSGPTGPLSGPTGPLSGPMGSAPGPRGPYGQPAVGPGYPQPAPGQNAVGSMAGDFSRMGMADPQRTINLMQEKRLIPPEGVETARPNLYHDHKKVNCNPDVFRCTLNAIPQTSSLLNKSRLPLGILIHPFKDLSQLPVIQSSVIVRCRSCRTYINPFVTFVDQRRWKCNLCFRVNDLPDEFSFDPVTKSYGEPQRRPEIKSATIEFIAPSEYMLRPPQPAVYLFVLDVSFNAIETGYLRLFTQTLIEELNRLPGDARTQIGFICFDRSLYFFNLSEGLNQPQMMVVPDLEDVFLPCPDSLMVNLHERRDMVIELLNQLPALFEGNQETGNALGPALQAAFKLMTTTGGRVTVMQTALPTVGPGALENREAASKNASLSVSSLGPASDFYKKLALDCSAQQVAVDLFMLNGQYADIATMSCISKYSAGCVQYYPSFHTVRNPAMTDKFEADLRRYLTRKIGFESVMRIRCTRGVSIHTFHGNFFVRSTDLLSLPNVNPDAGFGMQMSIEENLTEASNVCFQAALLYTSSKGERRIRVHSLCVPVTNQLSEVFAGADQLAIASLLAKMAADRTISSSLEDARDAMMNACQDMMNAFATQIPAAQRAGALMAPASLRLVPLLTHAMLKSVAFRLSAQVRVDDRVFAHLQAKCLPTRYLLQTYYPHLYPVHNLADQEVTEDGKEKPPKAPLLQLSSANVDRHGVYVMDQGDNMYLMVGGAVPDAFCQSVLDVPNFTAIPEGMTDLPELDNPTSGKVRRFIGHLMDCRPAGLTFLVLREDSKSRHLFFQHMVEDRTESSKSYYEFLQFVQQKVKG